MDIEQRLRESLAARANDVTPDPAAFTRVQQRIRRTRIMRVVAAGGVAVAGVAVLAVVLPGLSGQRVEFEPAPAATAPPEQPTQGAAPEVQADLPEAGGIAFSGGEAVYAMALDGESAELLTSWMFQFNCAEDVICVAVSDVAVRPGSQLGDAAGLARTVTDCGTVEGFGQPNPDGVEGRWTFSRTGCATSVSHANDGTGAWIERTSGDEWILATFDSTDIGPVTDDVATFGITDQYDDMILEDIVLGQQSGDATTGYAVVTARTPDGYEAFRLPMERQGDGALAVTGELEPYGYFEGYATVAFDDAGARPGPGRPQYAIEVLEDEAGGSFTAGRLVRLVDGVRAGTYELPPELLSNTTPAFDAADLWISSLGDTVLYGNAGTGMAWRISWTGDGWEGPFQLDATVVAADLLLGSTASPQPTDAPAATTDVDVYFAGQDSTCDSDRVVTREVDTPGVARGALNQLLAGPNPQEQNEGLTSPFTADTAGALLDVTIVDGRARVDLMHLGEWLDASPCTGDLVHSAIERTLLQFDTVDRVRITFDGNASLYRDWKESGAQPGPAAEADFPPAAAWRRPS